MTHQDSNKYGLLDPRFLEKSYQEAMTLTQDVAGYLEIENQQLRNYDLSSGAGVYYASESMRVSTCLMQVMSWFLVQKGVAAGEITREQAGAFKFRLGASDICLAAVDTRKGNLPEQFVKFLHKSQDLYRQVARIDKMVYGDRERVNPVHKLFSRIRNEDPPK
ncbi:MAG: DUF1465 family protein [Alphaproteobacteria bacterium]|nr:DUF1465 family protein [Alphaproteobacteria bacterium]